MKINTSLYDFVTSTVTRSLSAIAGSGPQDGTSSRPAHSARGLLVATASWFYGVLKVQKSSWGSTRKLSLNRGCPRRYQSQWNAQGQLFAPISSLRSCAAYPAARRSRNRQTVCPKEDIGSYTCMGYSRTLRPRLSARETGGSVVSCVAVNQKLARLKNLRSRGTC